MNYRGTLLNIKHLVITAILSLFSPFTTFAIDFKNGLDLSFFDEQKKAPTTPRHHTPAADFEIALKAYNNGNYIQAFKLFKTLARYGDANAQYNLGSMYFNGYGVLQDKHKAVLWYRQSARAGHVTAQHNIGALYYNGVGVVRNFDHAYKWFYKAARQGHSDSQYNLAVMYFAAKGVPQNRKLAFKWFSLAASQGDINAQHNLGAMYFRGIGVEKNMIQAFKWHTRAARNGHNSSQVWLRTQLKKKLH